MDKVEVSAKSEEEAVTIALDKLGLNRSEVEVVVLKRGRGGLFGLGPEEVKVRVTPLQRPSEGEVDVAAMARAVLENILSLMGVPASVDLEQVAGDNTEAISLNISGEDLGILIGRRGETLAALQYLVNLIVSRRLKARTMVTVDVEGYRQRRYEALRVLAQRLAEQVKSSGRSITLEPMPANERRIIHLELRDDPDVATQSVGLGEERKITILSKTTGGDKTALIE